MNLPVRQALQATSASCRECTTLAFKGVIYINICGDICLIFGYLSSVICQFISKGKQAFKSIYIFLSLSIF